MGRIQKFYSRFLVGTLTIIGAVFGTLHPASAHHIISANLQTNIQKRTGLGETDPVTTTTTIIGAILGILGVLAVGVIIYAGFTWMFSQGNEEKVTQAKGLLRGAVIGLLVILAAYGITLYIFQIIEKATGQGAIT